MAIIVVGGKEDAGMKGQRRSDGLKEILEVELAGLGHLEVRDEEAYSQKISEVSHLDIDSEN